MHNIAELTQSLKKVKPANSAQVQSSPFASVASHRKSEQRLPIAIVPPTALHGSVLSDKQAFGAQFAEKVQI